MGPQGLLPLPQRASGEPGQIQYLKINNTLVSNEDVEPDLRMPPVAKIVPVNISIEKDDTADLVPKAENEKVVVKLRQETTPQPLSTTTPYMNGANGMNQINPVLFLAILISSLYALRTIGKSTISN